jgi:hypothetical protein
MFGGALVAAAGLERHTRRWSARVVLALLVASGVLSTVLAGQAGIGLVRRAQLLTVAAGLLLGARVAARSEHPFIRRVRR